jgi:hypothetical protein
MQLTEFHEQKKYHSQQFEENLNYLRIMIYCRIEHNIHLFFY